MSWVYTLNGWCSWICGKASYREKCLSVEEIDVFKINGDDDDDSKFNLQNLSCSSCKVVYTATSL